MYADYLSESTYEYLNRKQRELLAFSNAFNLEYPEVTIANAQTVLRAKQLMLTELNAHAITNTSKFSETQINDSGIARPQFVNGYKIKYSYQRHDLGRVDKLASQIV